MVAMKQYLYADRVTNHTKTLKKQQQQQLPILALHC